MRDRFSNEISLGFSKSDASTGGAEAPILTSSAMLRSVRTATTVDCAPTSIAHQPRDTSSLGSRFFTSGGIGSLSVRPTRRWSPTTLPCRVIAIFVTPTKRDPIHIPWPPSVSVEPLMPSSPATIVGKKSAMRSIDGTASYRSTLIGGA